MKNDEQPASPPAVSRDPISGPTGARPTLRRALTLGAIGYVTMMSVVLIAALRAAAMRAEYESFDGRIPVWDRLAFVGADHITLFAGLLSIGCFVLATLPVARRASLGPRWLGASVMLSLGLGAVLAWVSWDAARSRVGAAFGSLDGIETGPSLSMVLESTAWLWAPVLCALVMVAALRAARPREEKT